MVHQRLPGHLAGREPGLHRFAGEVAPGDEGPLQGEGQIENLRRRNVPTPSSILLCCTADTYNLLPRAAKKPATRLMSEDQGNPGIQE